MSDYITDTKSVLDQTARVLQVTAAASTHSFVAALYMCKLHLSTSYPLSATFVNSYSLSATSVKQSPSICSLCHPVILLVLSFVNYHPLHVTSVNQAPSMRSLWQLVILCVLPPSTSHPPCAALFFFGLTLCAPYVN